ARSPVRQGHVEGSRCTRETRVRYPWEAVRTDQPSPPSGSSAEAKIERVMADHEKALPDEAASVSRLGMTYTHIPVDFQKPTNGDFGQFCSAMEQIKELPVHVHCIANYRVSAFFYRSSRCARYGRDPGAS